MESLPQALIRRAGYSLIRMPALTPRDIVAHCKDAVALIVLGERINRDIFEALSKLRVVARCGVGVDQVDLTAATEHGVQVTNVPDANYEEVAVHTLALVLALERRLFTFDASVRRGAWLDAATVAPMRRPRERVLGIVGAGRVGMRLAAMACAIGFQVQMHSREPADESRIRAVGARYASFEEVIGTSDVLSLHVPLTSSTQGMLSLGVMRNMKPGACVVNVSRGGLIDEDALLDLLGSGHLAGAALDVFQQEPLPPESLHMACEKLILTPHVAYLSEDSNREVLEKAVNQVIDVLQGRPPAYPVNELLV